MSLFDKRASARQFGFSRADLSSPTQVQLEPPPPHTHTHICRHYLVETQQKIPFLPPLLAQVPTLLPSWFSALSRGSLSGQRGASLIGRSLVSGVGPGVSWSPPSPSLQEEPAIHGALSEPQDPIGLEKAAVSHSDQALANQADGTQCGNGNNIKTEALEDD